MDRNPEQDKIPIKAIKYHLKQEYEDVFQKEIMGQVFFFRPLTKFEFAELIIQPKQENEQSLNSKSKYQLENFMAENVCELCTLFPEDYDFENPHQAGVPNSLYKVIKHESGYTNQEFMQQLVNEYRVLCNQDFDRQIENIILTAFPSIRAEEIKDWNIYKTLDYYTRAEWIIQNLMPMRQLPGEKQQQQQQKQQTQAQQPQSVQTSGFKKKDPMAHSQGQGQAPPQPKHGDHGMGQNFHKNS